MDPYQKYKNTVIATGDSVKQLVFVFDEVIKLLHICRKALGEKDYETKFNTLTKVIDVFYILRTGVDIEKGGEPVKMLDNFYASLITNLEQANLKADVPEDLDNVVTAVKMVRDSIQNEMQDATSSGESGNLSSRDGDGQGVGSQRGSQGSSGGGISGKF